MRQGRPQQAAMPQRVEARLHHGDHLDRAEKVSRSVRTRP